MNLMGNTAASHTTMSPLGKVYRASGNSLYTLYGISFLLSQDIYAVSRGLERMGVDCAVIYGSLPPGAKLGMAAKFNDPDDPCKVLVATDAVGMGLNLNIRRVVFYSMTKLQVRRHHPTDTFMVNMRTDSKSIKHISNMAKLNVVRVCHL